MAYFQERYFSPKNSNWSAEITPGKLFPSKSLVTWGVLFIAAKGVGCTCNYWCDEEFDLQLDQDVLWDAWWRMLMLLRSLSVDLGQHLSPTPHDLFSSHLCGITCDHWDKSKRDPASPGSELNKSWSVSQKTNKQTNKKKTTNITTKQQHTVLFCQCFWGGKANLSVKNAILTWGSLWVLCTWELFDCLAYNYINSEL